MSASDVDRGATEATGGATEAGEASALPDRAALMPRPLRRVVVKIGTQVLTGGGSGLSAPRFAALAAGVAVLRRDGRDVVLVSSGAVAAGVDLLRRRLPLPEAGRRPVREKQALAAIGQAALIETWRRHLDAHGLEAAQVLLTRFELEHREQYSNARNTLEQLLRWDVVPIINENDTTATDELKFGDNDGLAVLVATTLHADLLVILTEADGVYDGDPARGEAVRLIETIEGGDAGLVARLVARLGAGRGSRRGSGGIGSKLDAARRAAEGGIATVIASGRRDGMLPAVVSGVFRGTLVRTSPERRRLNTARGWLAAETRSATSRLLVNEGAARAVSREGRSLLPIGIVAVEGTFGAGDAVRVVGPDGAEVAKGIVAYGAEELRRLMGRRASEIADILGYTNGDEAIHRDAMLLRGEPRDQAAPREP